MNDLTKKSGDRGSMEESDLRTAFWLEDDIVQRFNKLYSVDYEYRKLRDAFSGTAPHQREDRCGSRRKE